MSYPTICRIFALGIAGSVILAVWIAMARLKVYRAPSFFSVLYPFFIAWIIITWDWVYLIFLWHR